MVEITCPDCGAKSDFPKRELSLFGRIECKNCGILLQVIDDDPIEVEIVDEDYASDADDDDDDDDDDEDDDR